MCYARRRRVVVVRRRVTCGVTVPIVQNDELQREHERAEQETSDYPPPYTPRAETWEGGMQSDNENPDQIQHEEMVNADEDHGTPPGSAMVPPPAYSPSPATISSENTNSAQTDPAQREGIPGNIEGSHGVTQGSTMVPPPEYSPSPADNQLENTTW